MLAREADEVRLVDDTCPFIAGFVDEIRDVEERDGCIVVLEVPTFGEIGEGARRPSSRDHLFRLFRPPGVTGLATAVAELVLLSTVAVRDMDELSCSSGEEVVGGSHSSMSCSDMPILVASHSSLVVECCTLVKVGLLG